MNIETFAEKLLELSPQFIRKIASYERDDLTRGEITLPQFWILDYLHRNEKDKMSSLAQYLSISPASATGLIDRLLERKLVVRKNDSQDRRVVWIKLTPNGKNVVHSIRKQKIQTFIKIFGSISPNDRERYLSILEQAVLITNPLPQTRS